MQNKFSDLLCSFRIGFSTQTALLQKLLQKRQYSLDKEIIELFLLIFQKRMNVFNMTFY